jgi:hypothetical protein
MASRRACQFALRIGGDAINSLTGRYNGWERSEDRE